jgi:hypothetical protein
MWTSKRFVLVMLITCATLFAVSVHAQEQFIPMYPVPKDEGAQGIEPIYTGVVIAYGETIDPPYYVEFRNDTVWVNNIPVEPTIKTWEEEPIEIVVSEVRRREYALVDSIGSDYIRFHDNYGEKRAMDMILEKYMPDTLTEKIEFHRPRKHMSSIFIKFGDGYSTYVSFSEMRTPNGKMAPPLRETTLEEQIATRKRKAGAIKSQLKRGFLIIFSLGYEAHIHPGREQHRLLDALERIATGETTPEQVWVEYPSLLPTRSTSFWKEFEQKKATWK